MGGCDTQAVERGLGSEGWFSGGVGLSGDWEAGRNVFGEQEGLADGSSSCGGSCSKTGQDMRGRVSSGP